MIAPASIRSWISVVDVDEQVFSWEHGGRPLRTRDFGNRIEQVGPLRTPGLANPHSHAGEHVRDGG